MKQAVEYYQGLPTYAKVVVGIGGVILAYVVYDSIRKNLSGDRAKMRLEGKDAENELRRLAMNGIRPSYPDSQYQVFANKIVVAANDCGTDEPAIFSVFEAMKNEADVQKLVSVFGIRKYKGCFSSYFGFEERSLGGLLNYELSGSEIKKINDMLAAKKIKFRF